jgi:hypothetical protein
VQIKLPEYAYIPGSLTNKFASGICSFESTQESRGLTRGGQELDLCSQFHALYFSTYVLTPQGLKISSLAFFYILLDRRRIDMPCFSYGLPVCLERCVFAPVLALDFSELLLWPFGWTLEEEPKIKWGISLRRICEQVHVPWHHFIFEYLRTVFLCNYAKQLPELLRDSNYQTIFLIVWYLNKIMINYVGIVCATLDFQRHISIPIERIGSFFCPPKRVVFAAQKL